MIVELISCILGRTSEFLNWALGKEGLFGCLSGLRSNSLKGFGHTHTLRYSSEDNMFAIEPAGVCSGDEELTSIGVGSSVCHWNAERFMLEHKVFVLESVSVDRLATCSITSCEITSLDHEVRNDSVERTACILTSRIIAFAKSDKVFDCFRDNSSKEIKDNIACGFSSDFDGDGDSVGGSLLNIKECTSLSPQKTAAESKMRIANLFMFKN